MREVSVLQLECDRVRKENHQLKKSTMRMYTRCSRFTGSVKSDLSTGVDARFRCTVVVHRCHEDLRKQIIRTGYF